MATTPISMQSAQDINTIIQTHMAWKRRIQDVIDGTNTDIVSVEILSADNQCMLGKWIYGRGKAAFKDQPVFQKLRETHAEFHQCAGAALKMAQTGQRAQARESIETGDMAAASRNMVMHLTDMYKAAKEAGQD